MTAGGKAIGKPSPGLTDEGGPGGAKGSSAIGLPASSPRGSRSARTKARQAEKPTNQATGTPALAPLLGEATEIHTQVLRLALGVEEARAYWSRVDPSVPPAARALTAFEQRWFGAKTLVRVKTLLGYFASRYDAFPESLGVLRRWREMDPAARQVICHWHLQLTDPIYRKFTGEFLLERRTLHNPVVDRPAVARWLRQTWPERWAEATVIQFASKLLSAGAEAGLLSPKRDPRALLFPKVPDLALVYLLYLLRTLHFQGTLTANPYLHSVGLDGSFLDQRLKTVRGVVLRRMGRLVEFDWSYPTLTAWAEASL